jgi:hypothetical protein
VIVEERPDQGHWVWDEPPSRFETMTLEEFGKLDPETMSRVLRGAYQRRGHWEKRRKYRG